MKLAFAISVLGLVLTDTTIGQPANLYARWLLNEGEGEIVFDISGNDLHGIIQNADNGTSTPTILSRVGYKLNPQEVAMGSTYYRRIDEVNDAEIISTYSGDTWSFEIRDQPVVDDH